MDDKFNIVSIPAEKFIFNKQLDGIISKGWVETSTGRALFKQAAQVPWDLPESRTDWSEKITAELAHRLQLPAAKYEFAQIESPDLIIPGSISTDLSNPGEKRIPLAEVLNEAIIDYDYAFNYEVAQIIEVLSKQDIKIPPGYKLPEGINDGVDMFVGVLMLDAYVGNTDRHDQNLDIVLTDNGTTYLSPVFDHGFSLGAVLDDRMRENNSSQRYSEVFSDSSFSIDGVDVSGLKAFESAAKLRPQAAKIWQNELSKINTQEIQELFDRIPEGIITPISAKFAVDLLSHNQSQLLNLNLEYSLGNNQTSEQQPLEADNFDRAQYNDLALQIRAGLGTLNQFQLDLEIYHQVSLQGNPNDGQRILQQSSRYLQLAADDPQKAKNYIKAIASVSSTYKQLPENTSNLDFWAQRLVNSNLAKQEVSSTPNNEVERQDELER